MKVLRELYKRLKDSPIEVRFALCLIVVALVVCFIFAPILFGLFAAVTTMVVVSWAFAVVVSHFSQ